LDAAIRTAEVVMGAGLSCKGLVSSTPIFQPKHCPLLKTDFLHPPVFLFSLDLITLNLRVCQDFVQQNGENPERRWRKKILGNRK
jgi:hypothetical protein